MIVPLEFILAVLDGLDLNGLNAVINACSYRKADIARMEALRSQTHEQAIFSNAYDYVKIYDEIPPMKSCMADPEIVKALEPPKSVTLTRENMAKRIFGDRAAAMQFIE
jgi:hypothetical protein